MTPALLHALLQLAGWEMCETLQRAHAHAETEPHLAGLYRAAHERSRRLYLELRASLEAVNDA